MDVVSSEVHRALAYVNAIQTSGGTLLTADLEEYMREPTMKLAKFGLSRAQRMMAQTMIEAFSGYGEERELIHPAEDWADYLRRLGWTSDSTSGVSLTLLGRALLRHLDKPDFSDDGLPVTVVIDPNDSLAYAKVLNSFNNAGPGMVVDAYVRFAQLADLLALGNITRILTSDRELGDRKATFTLALRGSTTELRVLPEKRLHDRYFISDAGRVILLGSSLNGITKRPGVVVPLSDPIAEEAIINSYNTLWAEAQPLIADSKGNSDNRNEH